MEPVQQGQPRGLQLRADLLQGSNPCAVRHVALYVETLSKLHSRVEGFSQFSLIKPPGGRGALQCCAHHVEPFATLQRQQRLNDVPRRSRLHTRTPFYMVCVRLLLTSLLWPRGS